MLDMDCLEVFQEISDMLRMVLQGHLIYIHPFMRADRLPAGPRLEHSSRAVGDS